MPAAQMRREKTNESGYPGPRRLYERSRTRCANDNASSAADGTAQTRYRQPDDHRSRRESLDCPRRRIQQRLASRPRHATGSARHCRTAGAAVVEGCSACVDTRMRHREEQHDPARRMARGRLLALPHLRCLDRQGRWGSASVASRLGKKKWVSRPLSPGLYPGLQLQKETGDGDEMWMSRSFHFSLPNSYSLLHQQGTTFAPQPSISVVIFELIAAHGTYHGLSVHWILPVCVDGK
jgi:hypothetical protein